MNARKWDRENPQKDLIIIRGDFNAKVRYVVMGKRGCGIMNENGEHLGGQNNLVIGGMLFPTQGGL